MFNELLFGLLLIIDCNFDGFKDISVLCNYGSGGCAYWIWNYSDKTKNFNFNTELSGNLGLEIDTISKFIIFHYRAGWQEEYWDSLNYQNSKLAFVKGVNVERWKDAKNKTWEKKTFRKHINGILKTRVDSAVITKY